MTIRSTDTEWVEGIRVPTETTLKKYGLTVSTWLDLAALEGFTCAICEKKPKSGVLHIEHEHARRWKKMPPEQRVLFIRGLVCQFCNRFVLARTITLRKARRIVWYLERYEGRST